MTTEAEMFRTYLALRQFHINRQLCVATLIVLCVVGIDSCARGHAVAPQAPESIKRAALQMRTGSLSRIEYYYLPEDVLVRAALSPDKLLSTAPYRASVTSVAPGSLNGIADALEKTSYIPSNASGDFRLGAMFYDSAGQNILSIFIDQTGTRATINGERFEISAGLRNRLREKIRCLASPN